MTTSTDPKKLPNVTIVGISRADNGMYTVADALHRTHFASDAAGLGMLLAQLVHDPDLPHSQIDTEQNENVSIASGIVRKLTKHFAPELAGLVESIEPAAHAIANTVERTRARGPRRRKAKTRVSRG